MKKSYLFGMLFAVAAMIVASCNTDDIGKRPDGGETGGNDDSQVIKFQVKSGLSLMRPGDTKANVAMDGTNYYMVPEESYVGMRAYALYGQKSAVGTDYTPKAIVTFLKAVVPYSKVEEISIDMKKLYTSAYPAENVFLMEGWELMKFRVEVMAIEDNDYEYYSPQGEDFKKLFDFMNSHGPNTMATVDKGDYYSIVTTTSASNKEYSSLRPMDEFDCPFYDRLTMYGKAADLGSKTVTEWPATAAATPTTNDIGYRFSMRRRFIGGADFEKDAGLVKINIKPTFAMLKVNIPYSKLAFATYGDENTESKDPDKFNTKLTGVPIKGDPTTYKSIGAIYRLTSSRVYNISTDQDERIGAIIMANKNNINVGREGSIPKTVTKFAVVSAGKNISFEQIYNNIFANYYPIEKMNIVNMVGDHTPITMTAAYTSDDITYVDAKLGSAAIGTITEVDYSEVKRFSKTISDPGGSVDLFIPVDLTDVVLDEAKTDKEVILNLGVMLNSSPKAEADMPVPFPFYSNKKQSLFGVFTFPNSGVCPAFMDAFPLPQAILDYYSANTGDIAVDYWQNGYNDYSEGMADLDVVTANKYMQRIGETGEFVYSQSVAQFYAKCGRNLNLVAKLEPAKVYNVRLTTGMGFGLEVESEQPFEEGDDLNIPLE